MVDSLAVADGGTAQEVATCAGQLAALPGYTVTIATLADNRTEVPVDSAARVVRLSGSWRNPISWLRSASELTRLIASHDAVSIHGIWGPIDGFSLSRADWQGKSVYIQTCGMLQDYILNRHRWKKWLARRLYVDRNLRNATALIANTEIEEKKIRVLGFRTPVVVIPNGVDLRQVHALDRHQARQELGVSHCQRVVLYLGRIHPKKGLDVFLQAFSLFVAKNAGWHLVVAGQFSDEAYKGRICDLVVKGQLERNVTFLGEVAGEKKCAAFSAADLFVLPSHSEGFSNAVLEAMAYRLPVILTPGCNFPELGEHGAGCIVEPTIEDLFRGLEWARSQGDGLTEIGSRGRQLIEEVYTTEAVIEQHRRLIELGPMAFGPRPTPPLRIEGPQSQPSPGRPKPGRCGEGST